MRIAASGSKAIVPFQVHDYGNHSWVILQKPAKNEIQKFVKLTDRNYACNDLINFEGEAQAMTETEAN